MYLIIQHEIEDFAAFQTAFEGHQPIRRELGVISERVYRNSADPNDVSVLLEFETEEGMKSMLADPRLAEAMKEATVASEPLFVAGDTLQPPNG